MAELYTVIIKNNTATDRVIEELGITILGNTTYNMSEQFDYHEIFGAETLRDFVSNGNLVVNNGTSDLSAVDGYDWIEVLNTYNAKDLFYTKSQLQTSGDSSIHWDNITNTPSYGAMEWKEPAKFIVLNTDGDTTGALPEDVIIDGTDYKQYDGSTWTTIGSISSGDRVINLDQAENAIIEYDGSVWTVPESPSESDAVMIDDDGDGKQAQYVYDGTSWKKIGDVDFAHHFNGDPSKHDASEIDVEGTYTNIPGTPTNLETTISTISSQLGSVAASAADRNTLDESYDEGGQGQGRIINADSGAVKIEATGGYSPLELAQLSTAPNTGLAGGQLCVVDGLLYVYDAVRLKWLSVNRELLVFGRKGVSKNTWLSFCVGNLPSNNSGFRLMRNGVITSISAHADTTVVNGNADIHVRRNDASPNIATLTMASGTHGTSDTNYNVNVLKDEFLQCYLEKSTTGGVEDVVVMMEMAYTV